MTVRDAPRGPDASAQQPHRRAVRADRRRPRWSRPTPPSVGRVVWSGSPVAEHVDRAVSAAREALGPWSRWSIDRRAEVLLSYKALVQARRDQIADLISQETGKALWDSRQEADALAGKVDITLEQGPHTGRQRVSGFSLELTASREGPLLVPAARGHGRDRPVSTSRPTCPTGTSCRRS
ncbi:MAG: hypothetical protein KatS3mg103_0423 [Phycisphaerales bacterium]|nr:MAG: hypothetical protein KatS3mg103_0423 [Phycisphaerales bacterium]